VENFNKIPKYKLQQNSVQRFSIWYMHEDGRSAGHRDEKARKHDEDDKNADEAGSDDGHVM
jgi:hypothetical protein